jgi:hypothetical protein
VREPVEIAHDAGQRGGHNRFVERGQQHSELDPAIDDQDSTVEHPDQGGIVEIPMVGGLHHRYTRQAA